MVVGVSVIICCYNSTERLPETLKHLWAQQVPANIPWEVIVVDNASTDDTYEFANRHWQKNAINTINFKVVKQPVAGLIHARKMGLATAAYEYLLFCDDDNWLNETYVTTAFEILQANHNIGALGGMGIAEAEQPALMDEEAIKQITACGPQTWADTDHWVYGAGTVYRKSILDHLTNNHWQQITTGRKGTSLISGEDVEICLMIYLSGYKIAADNRLTFKHFVPLKRQSITYSNNLQYWLGYTNVLLYSYFALVNHEKKSFEKTVSGWLIAVTKTILKHRVLSLLKIRSFYTSREKDFGKQLGIFHSLLHNSKKIIRHHYHIKSVLENINQNKP
jgi:glycosyltransferase involved in cell wall biosynthesis